MDHTIHLICTQREAEKQEGKKRDEGGGKTVNQFVSAALISAEGGRKRMPAAAGSLFAGTEWNI